MKSRVFILCLLAFAVGMSFPQRAKAQFKSEAFTQSYVDPNDTTFNSDTTDKIFSFKEYFGGLAHKNQMKIGTMFMGSMVLPGTAQIYNRQYWKLPIIYGGLGAFAGTGGYYLHNYTKSMKAHTAWETGRAEFLQQNPGGIWTPAEPVIDMRSKTIGTWLMVGAGAFYWGSMLDGAVCYDKNNHPLPGRATIYSMLLPGLGQAYNGEYWKIPVYYSGMMAAGFMVYTNGTNYKRFKRIHNEATNPEIPYTGQISGETAKYYRDVYRRYRDYSIVATVLVYLLQVIDANVFAYMHDFDMSDDLSLELGPAIIPQNNAYAFSPDGNTAFGLSLGLRF
ncbi:MAG: DUF5683 domain-containing protein [Bacteroidales bacterium]|nr:DUF5683 domain-containing protein [Bacteroidales bacterium]